MKDMGSGIRKFELCEVWQIQYPSGYVSSWAEAIDERGVVQVRHEVLMSSLWDMSQV